MTIDDESSIYVGGLPYDSTEDSVRRVFDLYGAVVAVKIINDRGTRGKCYGFVTFTNPRSAIDAINDMDGRTIDGRVIKVNEVKTRGGRSRFGRESFQRNTERGRDWEKGRDRERDYDQDSARYQYHSDRSRERDRSQDRDQEKELEYEYAYNHDQARSHSLDEDRDLDRNLKDIERDHSRNLDRGRERERDLNPDRDREVDGTNSRDNIVEMDRNQLSRKWNGPSNIGRHGREFLSNSSDDYDNEAKERIERSTQRLEELKQEDQVVIHQNTMDTLQKNISLMEERLEEKDSHVLDLQKKSKKLEDALINVKKHSSYRQMQLTKLHKCFLQVKDYSGRLKSCEQELQSLVDTVMSEDIGHDDVSIWGGILTNGKG